MRQTLALIVGSSILVIISVITITLSGGSITDFQSNTQNTGTNTQCEFQAEQYCDGNMDVSGMSAECVEQGYIQQQDSCSQSQADSAIAEATGIPVEE